MKISASGNHEYLTVLERIHKLDQFRTTILGPLNYGVASEIEKGILIDLQDKKVIKLHNLRVTFWLPTRIIHPPGEIPEGIKLETIQPTFDELYALQTDTGNEPPFPQNHTLNQVNKNEVFDYIKMHTRGKKRKKFLKILADGKPHDKKTLEEKIGVNDSKSIKSRVAILLKKTKWYIFTERPKEIMGKTYYRLCNQPNK